MFSADTDIYERCHCRNILTDLMANLILGAVVENFSYVFQASDGQVTSINREQMRAFKKTWSEFDSQRTGYLRRRDLVRFFGVRTTSSYLGTVLHLRRGS